MTLNKKIAGFAPLIILILVGIFFAAGVLYTNGKFKLPEKNINTAEIQPTPTPVKNTSPVVKTSSPEPEWADDPVDEKSYCPSLSISSDPQYPPFPPQGEAPLLVNLFSSSCGVSPVTLGGVSYVGVQWDIDGDGQWDTNIFENGPAIVTYKKSGTFKPKCRGRYSNNTWSKTCSYPYDIVVGEKNAFENDLFAVDKLDIETTISKASPDYDFPPKESLTLGSTNYIYRPGITVSSKNSFVHINIKSQDGAFGIYENNWDMLQGVSSRIHLYIYKNATNGVYEGEAKVSYTKDGKLYEDGPTINYKITLTD